MGQIISKALSISNVLTVYEAINPKGLILQGLNVLVAEPQLEWKEKEEGRQRETELN